MEHIHNCGNCAHFEACDSILKRYAGLSGIAKDGPACGNYAMRIEDILGDDYDLDRLRELVEADRDGRCVVLLSDDDVYTIRGDIVNGIIKANCRDACKPPRLR